MYEIARFLAATTPKVKKARKPARKAIKIGATIRLFRDGNIYTIVERDDRYKNAWFIANADGVRAPYSFGRDDMEVL